ncbi:von Willebrand factor D and EGF domain-containing protein [Drosophila miranda]|uniref:von Willebrand factor D and EGF domain-containing protein n=1 Tax=Drosophila miranda TaxID=7229 RepID=UPI0007E70ADB|nr:von Willebrand factor D and EGF domain-containing protein [Drosophila miranda]
MSQLLRTLGIQSVLLVLFLCLLQAMELQLHEQQLQQQQDDQARLREQQLRQQQQREQQAQQRRHSSTTTSRKPFIIPNGLSLPRRGEHPDKCYREVPAVFFQYDKEVKIVGNSTTNPHFNVIEVCCKGWRRYEYDWSKCVPDCDDRCQENGFCLAGGICQCFDDFVLNYRNNCVPTCPLGCPHGRCYLNGTCLCDKGYELDGSRLFCQPQCNQTCGHNEVCLEPGKCSCAEGYVRGLRESAALGCQPICIPDCGYGHCVAPNQCECFPGYHKRINGTSCENGFYKRCENGFRANETTCVCQNGFRYDNNTASCLPDCGDNCENGVCISPGNCRCFNGYVRNREKCEAVCDRGCGFYGKCIAPNVCGCAIVPGPETSYQKCAMGLCSSLGRCRCLEGKVRFIDKCMSPDTVTTYASVDPTRANSSLILEFELLLGRHFILGGAERFHNSMWWL